MNVVLLHALPLDERMWEPQLQALWEHEATAPNLYRLGGSSIDGWAMALLRQIPGEFVLVGASMGGYCALAVARLAPERVQGLVLAGSRADADPPERKEDRQDTIGRIQREGAEGIWSKMEGLLTARADEELAARLRSIASEQDPEGLVSAVRAIRDRQDSTGVVKSLPSPLRVVVGDGDALISPEEARALAKSAPRGKAVVLEGAGHLPSLEQPDRFNDELLRFLGTLE